MSLTLDLTGAQPANLVTGEVKQVETFTSEQYYFPTQGLFYSKDLVITYTDLDGDSKVLRENEDYRLLFAILDAVPNRNIYGAIYFTNRQLNGSISTTYRGVGGNFVLNLTDIKQKIDSIVYTPSIAYLGLTTLDKYSNAQGNKIELDSVNAINAVVAQAGSNAINLTIKACLLPEGERIINGDLATSVALSQGEGGTVTASDGTDLPIDTLPHTYGYVGNKLTTDTVIYNGRSYVKTYTYTGEDLTGETPWTPS